MCCHDFYWLICRCPFLREPSKACTYTTQLTSPINNTNQLIVPTEYTFRLKITTCAQNWMLSNNLGFKVFLYRKKQKQNISVKAMSV